MKRYLIRSLALMAIPLTLIACSNGNMTEVQQNSAGGKVEEESNEVSQNNQNALSNSLIEFPENYEEGVLYTTVTRGSAFEELYTSKETIEAVQNGEPIPSGTIITLKIYEDEELDRIFVMEKRNDWDPDYLSEQRNGEWAYQSFRPDGTVNEKENIGRCISCHAGQESDDFLYKLEEMKNYNLKDLASLQENSTASLNPDIHSNDWGIQEIALEPGDSDSQAEQVEKNEILQNVLLTFYLNELENGN